MNNRLHALMPFAECIRKHLQNVIGVAVDVKAFNESPSHLRQLWTDDPISMAFTRSLLAIIEPLAPSDNISVICDDEEHTALPMYKLYRQVKLVYADARRRLASLSFADDEVFYALQAADFVASLLRLEAKSKFSGEEHQWHPLWESFNKSLVGEICGSPIRSNGHRKLGSCSPRTRCGIARLQLFLFVASCLSN